LFGFSIIFPFITISRPIAVSKEIESIERNVISQVKRAIDVTNKVDTEDPNFILESAIMK